MWSTIVAICFAALAPTTTPSPAVDARPTVMVVVGAEGTPEFGRQFATWADRWAAAAQKRSAQFIRVGSDSQNPEDDKNRLKAAIDAQPKAAAQPPLWIILIGHGTYDGREAKFNLRGPDVSDAELAEWLKPFQRPLAVIDCT